MADEEIPSPRAFDRRRLNIVINRKHTRVQQLLGHVLHVVAPYLKDGPDDTYRDCARELEDLFYSAGVDIITEQMRAEAGLPMRDHHGLTLDELRIIENRMIEEMTRPIRVPGAADCPRCGFLGEPAKP